MALIQEGSIWTRVVEDGAARPKCVGADVLVNGLAGPLHNQSVEYVYVDQDLKLIGPCSSSIEQFQLRFRQVVATPKPPEPEWSYSRADELHAAFLEAANAFNEYIKKQPKQHYFTVYTGSARSE